MAELPASSLMDPLQRMPLVRSELLCPAWKAPQEPVPEEASGCVRYLQVADFHSFQRSRP